MAMASGGAGAAAAATAERLAEAEGLTLIPSSNACGYLGVSVCGKDGYQARIKVDGRDERIGWYPSAAEAALAYARYLGPARCAELAQRPLKRRRNPPGAQNSGFGVPQYVLPNGAGDMSVACVVDEDTDDADQAALAIVHEADSSSSRQDAETADAGLSGQGRAAIRRYTARTDEYEFTMPTPTRALSVPVPEGAVRAVCRVTFEFA